ncbi:SDR family oxidoreductase [Phaeovulum sp. NW3]|uniref:SDR family NAD(P)-dependent oxidoreductase n=1 Tax=Phaeovulum sp. NW3 TaxID=2934933 RepID=UPI0020206488|nr:SDR family oxidoreductase [Phaeovulum sp. NW3]MCL7466686.1 SDR family oxidoreductase [Phaeovulum sp. NW3]
MHMTSLEGQVAVITGGAGAIGAAIALALGQSGARIALWDQNAAALEAVADMLSAQGITVCLHTGDLTQEDEVEAATTAALAAFGRIDMLVTATGLSPREDAITQPLGNWQRSLDVNMTSVFLASRIVVREMLARAIAGRIVHLGSIMGLSGGGLYPNLAYHATKGAIVNMTRAMACEWAPHGIRVNSVAPTWVDTPFIGALKADPEAMRKIASVTPLGRIARPEEVAQGVVFLLSEHSAMITGHTLPIDGGFLAK